ncbi:SH3 domain-containing protein [Streptomyces sp. NPDC091201]|uniref:SH3 domain-containing protein n=1 Tax=Streptomyces sp. NPDC091201 TaxID=3155190 RepID=UPI00341C1646
MLKPTRTILALATGSLVVGLVGAGAALADEGTDAPREIIVGQPANAQPGDYSYDRYAAGKVVSKGPLTVRSKPTTRSQSLGRVAANSRVEIKCKKNGEKVDGNSLWYRLRDNNSNGNSDWENGADREDRTARKAYDKERWVSARYVKNLSEVKYCR